MSGIFWKVIIDWIFEPFAGDHERFFTRPTIVMLCIAAVVAIVGLYLAFWPA